MELTSEKQPLPTAGNLESESRESRDSSSDAASTELINASGHKQELTRNFSLFSLTAVGIVVGNTWPAVGGSILVAIFNGGPPGVLYEFIVVSLFFFFVAACIAELASAIPSSGGVYHWASVTPGPRWGRVIGFFAGYWNWLAWVFGATSMSSIFANTIVQMYALTHPDFVPQPWHTFVVYVIATWIACFTVCFGNKALPYINKTGVFFIVGGFLITVIVVTVMPGRGGRPPHATSAFVWKEWQADIGYSNGFVFVAGMLNGAYAIGVPDAVTHLAEEVPFPQRNLPIAIAIQLAVGFVTGFCYLVAILYAINDYEALFTSTFPLAEIYRQGTGSSAGAIGLLCIFLICIALTMIGTYIDAGRALWAMARDKGSPFSKFLSHVNKGLQTPVNATLLCGALVTVLGCISLGSTTAFNAFVGSFALMTSSSYIAAILPHLLTGRKNIGRGPFHLGDKLGVVCNVIACAYMLVWFVIYSFPFALPVTAQNMNYVSLIWGGFTIFVATWWFAAARHGYVGPTATGGVIYEADMIDGRGTGARLNEEASQPH